MEFDHASVVQCLFQMSGIYMIWASEIPLTSMSVTGLGMVWLRLGWWRTVDHQLRSSTRPFGAYSEWKGLELKSPSMASILVRKAWPLGMIEQECSSFP